VRDVKDEINVLHSLNLTMIAPYARLWRSTAIPALQKYSADPQAPIRMWLKTECKAVRGCDSAMDKQIAEMRARE